MFTTWIEPFFLDPSCITLSRPFWVFSGIWPLSWFIPLSLRLDTWVCSSDLPSNSCVCVCVCVGACVHMCVLVAQSCLTLCDPMDCSQPGSPVHGILQARILEWVAIPFSRGSFQPRDWTPGLLHYMQILYHWATRDRLVGVKLWPSHQQLSDSGKAISRALVSPGVKWVQAPLPKVNNWADACWALLWVELCSSQKICWG